jgi:beta-lactamase regulating signal transducer with metallopeptidase domain
VILLWLVGALLFALHFASSLFALGRVYRSAAFIRGGREFALIEKCREAIGTRANVTLAFAGPDSRITMPITWGYLQPVIVLPISAKEWDDGHLTAAFLHELAHIRRRDWLQQLLGLAVCCVYWFNPLVWAAVGNLREECEAASDDIVIRSGMKPAEYARHLLETAKSAGDNPRYAIAMVRKRRLENRLRYLPRTTRIALRHTLSGPLQCVRPRS